MEEIWKTVPELNGRYEVSNLGNARYVGSFIRGGHRIRPIKPVFKDGYSILGAQILGKKRLQIFSIHRLVAKAFIPNLDNKPSINHKNGIKSDNRVENLEWCDARENALHAYRTGLHKGRKGVSHKLHPSDIPAIRRAFFEEKIQGIVLAKQYNLTPSAISAIVTSKTWGHIHNPYISTKPF